MNTKEKKLLMMICMFVVGLYVVGIPILMLLNKAITLEMINIIAQIFSSIFVVMGVIITVFQYLQSAKEQSRISNRELEIREKEIQEIEKDRIQNAINLSNYYKDNILDCISIIDSIYEDTGIKSILDSVDITLMVEFDSCEMERILRKEQLQEIRTIGKSKKFVDVVIRNSEIYGYGENAKRTISKMNPDGTEEVCVKVNTGVVLREFANILSNALNNTEYFAMNFTHETADETVIYQSLHKTYLSLMKVMYYDIACNNEPGGEKLFTNAIELFNIWRDRAEEQRLKKIESQKDLIKKGTELKKINK